MDYRKAFAKGMLNLGVIILNRRNLKRTPFFSRAVMTPLYVNIVADGDWHGMGKHVWLLWNLRLEREICISVMAFPKKCLFVGLGKLTEATEVACVFFPILIIEGISISTHAEAITDNFIYTIYTSYQHMLNYGPAVSRRYGTHFAQLSSGDWTEHRLNRWSLSLLPIQSSSMLRNALSVSNASNSTAIRAQQTKDRILIGLFECVMTSVLWYDSKAKPHSAPFRSEHLSSSLGDSADFSLLCSCWVHANEITLERMSSARDS